LVLASTSQPSAVARLAELSLPGRVHVGAASEAVRRLPIGVRPLDAVLNGGLPRGRISELIGPLSSGKTSLALTLLATATRRGEVVACIDPAEALHPASLAIAGTDLQRLLWVRPPSATAAMRCAELLLQAGGFAVVVLDLGVSPPRPLRGQVWPRLLHAAEQSHTALIVVAPERVAGSFAAVSLGLQRRTPLWRRGLWALFDGFETATTVVRNKLGAPGKSTVIRACESCSWEPLHARTLGSSNP
jgi:hypothetical protein